MFGKVSFMLSLCLSACSRSQGVRTNNILTKTSLEFVSETIPGILTCGTSHMCRAGHGDQLLGRVL